MADTAYLAPNEAPNQAPNEALNKDAAVPNKRAAARGKSDLAPGKSDAALNKSELIERVARFIGDESADSFEDLALALFRFQSQAIPLLGAYWNSLGATPETVARFTDIPPVPLGVFKRHSLFAGEAPVRVFRTSGTSGSPSGKISRGAPGENGAETSGRTTGPGLGESFFDQADLDLMARSILGNASRSLFPDDVRTRFLMLAPMPEEQPESIMAHGMRLIAKHFGLGEPLYAVSRGGLLAEEAREALASWTRAGEPVTLIGGSFGFANLIDRLGPGNGPALAPGSRLLDAGGFKGRSRELDRREFVGLVQTFFGLPEDMCLNLYGLTELASQFYSRGQGPKIPPHWTRVRVCEPLELMDLEPGREGVAVLYDLANVARPMAILTDDLARARKDGRFDILRRASGSLPRGCSLRLEEVR